jgi:hemerythrin-like domain-containing protein
MASRSRGRSRSSGRTSGGRSAGGRSSGRSSSRGPDAIQLLRKDHTEVQALFKKYEKGSEKMASGQKKQLAEQICHMLTVHAQIEEEIFYPACEQELDAEDIVAEAKVEHTSAKELIAKIEAGRAGSEEYDAHVTVLGEYINHHVKEEQNELFPKVKKSKMDLKAIGQQLAERKMSLMQSGDGKTGVGGWLSHAMS